MADESVTAHASVSSSVDGSHSQELLNDNTAPIGHSSSGEEYSAVSAGTTAIRDGAAVIDSTTRGDSSSAASDAPVARDVAPKVAASSSKTAASKPARRSASKEGRANGLDMPSDYFSDPHIMALPFTPLKNHLIAVGVLDGDALWRCGSKFALILLAEQARVPLADLVRDFPSNPVPLQQRSDQQDIALGTVVEESLSLPMERAGFSSRRHRAAALAAAAQQGRDWAPKKAAASVPTIMETTVLPAHVLGGRTKSSTAALGELGPIAARAASNREAGGKKRIAAAASQRGTRAAADSAAAVSSSTSTAGSPSGGLGPAPSGNAGAASYGALQAARKLPKEASVGGARSLRGAAEEIISAMGSADERRARLVGAEEATAMAIDGFCEILLTNSVAGGGATAPSSADARSGDGLSAAAATSTDPLLTVSGAPAATEPATALADSGSSTDDAAAVHTRLAGEVTSALHRGFGAISKDWVLSLVPSSVAAASRADTQQQEPSTSSAGARADVATETSGEELETQAAAAAQAAFLGSIQQSLSGLFTSEVWLAALRPSDEGAQTEDTLADLPATVQGMDAEGLAEVARAARSEAAARKAVEDAARYVGELSEVTGRAARQLKRAATAKRQAAAQTSAAAVEAIEAAKAVIEARDGAKERSLGSLAAHSRDVEDKKLAAARATEIAQSAMQAAEEAADTAESAINNEAALPSDEEASALVAAEVQAAENAKVAMEAAATAEEALAAAKRSEAAAKAEFDAAAKAREAEIVQAAQAAVEAADAEQAALEAAEAAEAAEVAEAEKIAAAAAESAKAVREAAENAASKAAETRRLLEAAEAEAQARAAAAAAEAAKIALAASKISAGARGMALRRSLELHKDEAALRAAARDAFGYTMPQLQGHVSWGGAQPPLEAIDLSNTAPRYREPRLRLVAANFLLRQLQQNGVLTSLDLSGNRLGDGIADKLLDFLGSRSCAVRTLNLADNELVGAEDDAPAKSAVGGLFGLGSLFDAPREPLTVVAAVAAAFDAGGNRSLTKLDVVGNDLGEGGLAELGRAVLRNRNSQLAFLCCDAFRLDELTTTLDMGAQGLRTSTALALAGLLRSNRVLTALDTRVTNMRNTLRVKRISAEAVRALGEAVLASPSLQVFGGVLRLPELRDGSIDKLELFNECLGSVEGVVIAGLLEAPKCALTAVNLRSNALGHIGGVGIAQALKRNHTLRSLNLRDNNLNEATGTALAEALQTNTTLTELDVRHNLLAGDALRTIARTAGQAQGRAPVRVKYLDSKSETNLLAALDERQRDF